jgi:hypothetical protein
MPRLDRRPVRGVTINNMRRRLAQYQQNTNVRLQDLENQLNAVRVQCHTSSAETRELFTTLRRLLEIAEYVIRAQLPVVNNPAQVPPPAPPLPVPAPTPRADEHPPPQGQMAPQPGCDMDDDEGKDNDKDAKEDKEVYHYSAESPPYSIDSPVYSPTPSSPDRDNDDKDAREDEDDGLPYSAESPPYSIDSPVYSPTPSSP